MSDFERAMPSYRLVQTRWEDDLQAVASRELGDANRWPELVWLNSLVWPYLTQDDRRVAAGVLLAGTALKVPAATPVFNNTDNRGEVYERDCALVGRLLVADDSGDLVVLAGVDNLRQQLSHALDTPRGQARRHPDYGCLVWRLQGRISGPTAARLGAEYIKATLLSDYRVSSVASSRAEVIGDAIRITARAVAIEGGAIDIAPSQD